MERFRVIIVGVVAFGYCLSINATTYAATNNKLNFGSVRNDYQHALPLLSAGAPDEVVPKNPVPLLLNAIKNKEVANLESVGLIKVKTVFVPRIYTQSHQGILFIGNVKYTTPDGYSNVASFLPTNYGYLIAVAKPRSNANPFSEYTLTFYKVSKFGKTLKEIAKIPVSVGLKNRFQVITTKNAIFGSEYIDSTGKRNFQGITKSGRPIVGPQNVFDATALKNGGWLILRRYNPNFPMINGWKGIGNNAPQANVAAQTTIYYQAKNGASKLLGTSPIKYFLHTLKIFVNAAPITDSAQTNLVWTISEYRSCTDCGNVFRTYPFGLLIYGENAQITQGDGMYVPVIPRSKIINNFALTEIHNQPMNFWQGRRYGNWLFATNPIYKTASVYRIMGWKNNLPLDGSRGFVWGGDTRIAQYIQTPRHFIIYSNRADSKTYEGYKRQGLAYDFVTRKYIPSNQMLSWLSQHGVLIGKSLSLGY